MWFEKGQQNLYYLLLLGQTGTCILASPGLMFFLAKIEITTILMDEVNEDAKNESEISYKKNENTDTNATYPEKTIADIRINFDVSSSEAVKELQKILGLEEDEEDLNVGYCGRPSPTHPRSHTLTPLHS